MSKAKVVATPPPYKPLSCRTCLWVSVRVRVRVRVRVSDRVRVRVRVKIRVRVRIGVRVRPCLCRPSRNGRRQ